MSSKLRAAPLVLLALGALALGGGGWAFFGRGAADEAARVASLPRVAPGELEPQADGAAILLQGTLLPREPLGPQGFAVYREQAYRSTETEGASKGRERWNERSVPQTLLAVGDGTRRVDLCNRDYALAGELQKWQSELTLRSGDLVHEPTLRRFGLKPGDRVTVDGHVTRREASRCLKASTVFGGSATSYAEAKRTSIVAVRIIGAAFAAVGVVLLAMGVFLLRKTRS